jgi:DNA-binding NarL/FixJ family response regulator
MLLASVPTTIDARVAREVLDVADPEPLLDSLAGQGLLHRTDDSFRLHPLLRSFLRKKLEADETERHRELTARAIADAQEDARWEEAFELALEAGLTNLAAETLEDATAEMLASGKVEILERWLEECGSLALERPGAVLARVEILTRKGLLTEAAGTAMHLASRLTPDEPQASRAQYLAGRAYHLMSKGTSALECHLAARSYALTANDLSNALWGAYLAASELGLADAPSYLNELENLALPDLSFRLRVATGRMAHAISIGTLSGVSEAFEHLISVSMHASDPMDETSFLTRAAEVEVLRARYAPARLLAKRALESAETLNLEFARPFCLVPLIAADIGLRQFGLARDNLFRISQFAHANGDPYLDVSTRYLQMKLHASDPRARLPSLPDEEVDESVDAASRAALLGLSALQHAVGGNTSKALALARQALETCNGVEAKYYSRAAELIVSRRNGQGLEALRSEAARFVKDAAHDQVLDAVVVTCRTDPEFAHLVAADGVASRIAGQTLTASGDRRLVEKAGIVAAESRIKPQTVLTARELEVLELLGRGFSNAEIARELVISLSTAKVHVHHVLKKLGLQTRLQAGLIASEVETTR